MKTEANASTRLNPAAQQARQMLYAWYIILPIVAGLDKFLHVLTEWHQYLAPAVQNVIPLSGHAFMNVVGLIEIIAGIIVAVSPKIGGYVVGLWLLGIVLNLLIGGMYLDIAARDLGLAIGAFALARLSR